MSDHAAQIIIWKEDSEMIAINKDCDIEPDLCTFEEFPSHCPICCSLEPVEFLVEIGGDVYTFYKPKQNVLVVWDDDVLDAVEWVDWL